MVPREVHQILPFFAYGDAIGNQALELRELLRRLGHRSDIFAENWDRRLEQECYPYQAYERHSSPNNLLIFHYSTSGQVNQYVRGLRDRVVLYYHNITPPRFFYWINGELARELEEAQHGLKSFAATIPAIAASPYNAQELQVLGFQMLGIAPYIVRLEQLDKGLAGRGAARILRQFSDPQIFDWLYVGRIVPNKCIQDIIKSFYYFNKWIIPSSRLFLVGSGEGAEDYVRGLVQLTDDLLLGNSVIFAGHYGAAEGLGAFYKIANLYVCMSEHEGFCIPLIEAMHYGLPVIAYAATGVPFTLGNAGVSIKQKNHPMIAEVAYEIMGNERFRSSLLKGQSARLTAFDPEATRSQVYNCLRAAMDR